MSAVAEHTSEVRARGLGLLGVCSAVAFLVVALTVGVLAGPVDLGVGAVLESAGARLGIPGVSTSLSPTEEAILWEIRVPRVVLAALVGAMLALAGATYQGVFRNPLADPYLLGVAAGAGLGATIAIAYLPDGLRGQRMLPVAAFVGGSVAVMLTYAVGRSARRERDAATLILAGVTVTAFFTAWQTFVQQQNSETLQEVYSWILGNIPSTGWSDVVLILPYVAVAAIVIVALRRVVDVLNLGDDEAASLGVDVRRVRLALVVAATLGTAAAVAVTGLIGFVGIIVPHTIRLLTGVGYRALIPLSVIVGAGFLVLADVVARTALAPAEIPLGVVTAFFGAPFFALVLRTTRGGSGVIDAARRHGRARRPRGRGRRGRRRSPTGSGSRSSARTAPARRRCFARSRGSCRSRARSSSTGDAWRELSRAELARLVAVVPQEPSTPPWMTVAEYVLLGRTPHLGPLAKEGARDREAAARSLARLDLLPFADRRLGTLSGGEKQRVVVARALAQEAGSSCSTSRPLRSTSATSSRRSSSSTACARSPG